MAATKEEEEEDDTEARECGLWLYIYVFEFLRETDARAFSFQLFLVFFRLFRGLPITILF